jgi:hypothetical protein
MTRGTGLQSRLGAALLVQTLVVLGLTLVVAPWTALWTRAALVLVPEALCRFVLSGWVRGAVSGLGVVDLALAAQAGTELWRLRGRGGRETEPS